MGKRRRQLRCKLFLQNSLAKIRWDRSGRGTVVRHLLLECATPAWSVLPGSIRERCPRRLPCEKAVDTFLASRSTIQLGEEDA